MNAERRAYLDTSALAKWYLNEPGSEDFVRYLQDLDVAAIMPKVIVAPNPSKINARPRLCSG